MNPAELTIDRSSFEPAYRQLANLLRKRIASGEFRSGDPLPSESQLRSQYDISAMTVRRAINLLLDQDVVYTTQGRGTFVKPLQLQAIHFGLDEFVELFQEESQAQVRVLHAGIVRAEPEVAAKLEIAPGDRAIHITSLISSQGEPLVYHWGYLIYDPTMPVVEAQIEVTSLAGLFCGGESSQLKSGRMTLEAMVLDKPTADRLEVPPGSAALQLTHIFHDYHDRPVSWGGFVCRGDRMSFSTNFGAACEPDQNYRRTLKGRHG